jgi:hypothetical protein
MGWEANQPKPVHITCRGRIHHKLLKDWIAGSIGYWELLIVSGITTLLIGYLSKVDVGTMSMSIPPPLTVH